MKTGPGQLKLLFIINPGSGNGNQDFKQLITAFFDGSMHRFELYELPENCNPEKIKAVITAAKADRVIAVGGDGTLKLVADALTGTTTPIGIIPAGSANGMAKELGIPLSTDEALRLTVEGQPRQIHATMVNNELCIHLSDIGFNAYLVKKFDSLPGRGMWGYAKATWKALWSHHIMEVAFDIKGETIRSAAAMVVIANATRYGTGVIINPEGKLDDDVFEVILIKKYSVMEILKIWATNLPFNPEKIELFQTSGLQINTKHKVHFQVDGEYIGKVNQVNAKVLPAAISIIV
jgi:diacylglycerol kinase (ATP)